jgi:hypothetical protein
MWLENPETVHDSICEHLLKRICYYFPSRPSSWLYFVHSLLPPLRVCILQFPSTGLLWPPSAPSASFNLLRPPSASFDLLQPLRSPLASFGLLWPPSPLVCAKSTKLCTSSTFEEKTILPIPVLLHLTEVHMAALKKG